MAEDEEDGDKFILRESPWPYHEKYMSLNETTVKKLCIQVLEEAALNVQDFKHKFKGGWGGCKRQS